MTPKREMSTWADASPQAPSDHSGDEDFVDANDAKIEANTEEVGWKMKRAVRKINYKEPLLPPLEQNQEAEEEDDTDDFEGVSPPEASTEAAKKGRHRLKSADWSNPVKNMFLAQLLRQHMSYTTLRVGTEKLTEIADAVNERFPREQVLVTHEHIRNKRDDLRKCYQMLMDLKYMELAQWDEENFQVQFTSDQWNIIAHYLCTKAASRSRLPFLARLRYREANPDLKMFEGLFDEKKRKGNSRIENLLPSTNYIREMEQIIKVKPLANFFKRMPSMVAPKFLQENTTKSKRILENSPSAMYLAKVQAPECDGEGGIRSRDEVTQTEVGALNNQKRWFTQSPTKSREQSIQRDERDEGLHTDQEPKRKKKRVRFVDDADADGDEETEKGEVGAVAVELSDSTHNAVVSNEPVLSLEQVAIEKEKKELEERDVVIEQIYQRVESLVVKRLVSTSLYKQFLSIDALDVYAFFRHKYRLNDTSVSLCVQVLVEISQSGYE